MQYCSPFGIVLSGLLSQGSWTWVHKFVQTLDHLYQGENPDLIDFAIPAFGDASLPTAPYDAMTCAEALYVRYYLQLPWSTHNLPLKLDVSSHTAHGLKATLLSWAAQTDISFRRSSHAWQTQTCPDERTIVLQR